MANPVEYLQEKARRSTSVLLLKSHPPHARLSGGEEQTNKSATPRTPKSHPTNLPTLQSAYSNRPTTQKEEQKIQQQTKQQKWPQIECPKLPCCYNVPTHITICRRRQSSPELTTNKQNSIIIINRRAIHHTTVIIRHQPSAAAAAAAIRLDNNNHQQQESNIERVRDSVKDHLISKKSSSVANESAAFPLRLRPLNA